MLAIIDNMAKCPFCDSADREILAKSDRVYAVFDSHPVSRGHTLIIPRRHVSSVFKLADAERSELWHLVNEVRSQLEREFHPNGFNIGVNDGRAAGQTIEHAHIHVIPRYLGDVSDPRGGVRFVIPNRAKYWE